jgi:hypothetical protein
LVIFHSIADSVGNKKPNTDGLTDDEARQKKISCENITDGILSSAFLTVLTDEISVGDGGMTVNVLELCQIPTDRFCW